MKGLILLIAMLVLVMILASSSASAVSDSETSPICSGISHKEITTNQTQANNSSASATITIRMTGVLDR